MQLGKHSLQSRGTARLMSAAAANDVVYAADAVVLDSTSPVLLAEASLRLLKSGRMRRSVETRIRFMAARQSA